jgi:hypothetical protein
LFCRAALAANAQQGPATFTHIKAQTIIGAAIRHLVDPEGIAAALHIARQTRIESDAFTAPFHTLRVFLQLLFVLKVQRANRNFLVYVVHMLAPKVISDNFLLKFGFSKRIWSSNQAKGRHRRDALYCLVAFSEYVKLQ